MREIRLSIGAALVTAGTYAMVNVLVLNALQVTIIGAAAGAILGVGAVAGGIALMREGRPTYDSNKGGRR